MGLLEFIRRLFLGEPDGERPKRVRRREPPLRLTMPPIVRPRGRREYVRRWPGGSRDRVAENGLPWIPNREALARFLGLSMPELLWLADPQRISAPSNPHYRMLVRNKRGGGARVLLAPRPRLAAVQRKVLRTLLDPLEPTPWAHGFVRGRSIRSYAHPHVGREVVVHLDLADFFHHFTLRDVSGLFHALGYPPEVSRTLAYLTTAPVRDMAESVCRGTSWPPQRFLNAVHPARPSRLVVTRG